ncbi:MAG TPA: hypothetical protein VEH29_15825 [Acidimicrobiales bacterium]|nr:hypothetical protein [Acidimicrobiales bacterium]
MIIVMIVAGPLGRAAASPRMAAGAGLKPVIRYFEVIGSFRQSLEWKVSYLKDSNGCEIDEVGQGSESLITLGERRNLYELDAVGKTAKFSPIDPEPLSTQQARIASLQVSLTCGPAHIFPTTDCNKNVPGTVEALALSYRRGKFVLGVSDVTSMYNGPGAVLFECPFLFNPGWPPLNLIQVDPKRGPILTDSLNLPALLKAPIGGGDRLAGHTAFSKYVTRQLCDLGISVPGAVCKISGYVTWDVDLERVRDG